jgi:uncharacterized repeat protein (TIGR01451 family)
MNTTPRDVTNNLGSPGYKKAAAVVLLIMSLGGMLALSADNTLGSLKKEATHGELRTVDKEAMINFDGLAEMEKLSPHLYTQKPKPSLESPLRSRSRPQDPATTFLKTNEQPSAASLVVTQTQLAALAPSFALPPSPLPSASFPAVLDNGTTLNPDTHGAVGPNHLVVTLNSGVTVQDRSGKVLSSISQNAFWASVGASNIFDPRVLYDPYAQRWIFTAQADPGGNNPGLLIAVSATSDPRGNWYLKFIDLDKSAPLFGDSPKAGFNKDWIVVQVNIFSKTNLNFVSSDVYVFNKTNFYAGGSIVPTRFTSPYASQVPATVYDPDLAEVYLAYNYSGSVPEFDIDTGIRSHYGELYLWTISGPVSSPQLEFASIVYSCEECTWADWTPQANFLPQLGSTNKISPGDSRLQNLVFRDGTYYTCHTVFFPTNNPKTAVVQWWQFTPAYPFNGSLVLTQDRIVDSTGGFFAFPSIAVNRYSQYLIGYTRFSSNSYPSANYTFVTADDFARGDTTLKLGESSYRKLDSNGLNRWGDWSATTVDPLNDTDFWTIQEYAATNGSSTILWGTWWGRIGPPMNLSIRSEAAPDPVLMGGTLTYDLSLYNDSVLAAGGVVVSNLLSPEVSFVSASASQGSCGHSNGIVICNLATVDTFARLSIVVRTRESGSITNVATVTSTSSDSFTNDNTAMTISTVEPLVLGLYICYTPSEHPILTFNSISGGVYIVEYKNDLNESEWTPLATLNGTGSQLSFEGTLSPAGTTGFYRIRIE